MGPDVCRIRSLSALIKRSLLMLFVGEEFFFSRKGMRPARLPVDCRDADLHLRNHRSRQTDPYLRGQAKRPRRAASQRPGNWRRSAACDLGWLQPSYSRKICWSFGRLGRFTLSLDLGRVAGHFPIVKIFGPLESFRDLVK